MLRIASRMPGPLYVGNYLKNKWEARDFEKKGDLDIEKVINPMEMFIQSLYQKKQDGFKKFWSIVDKDKLASWMALMSLTGGIHSDIYHNQLFYFDPTLGKIEPVLNDVLGLGTLLYPGAKDRLLKKYIPDHTLPLNEKLTPITDYALRDPLFLQLKNKKIYEKLFGMMSYDNQKKKLELIYNQIKPNLVKDRNKSYVMELFVGYYRVPFSINWFQKQKQVIFNFINDRNKFLLQKLTKNDLEIIVKKINTKDLKILISINGHSSVNFNTFALKKHNLKADFSLNNYFSEVINDKLELYPGLKKEKNFYFEQTKDRRGKYNYNLLPSKQYYLFRVSNVTHNELIQILQKSFVHTLTKNKINPVFNILNESNDLDFSYNKISIHPWKIQKNYIKKKNIILGPGEINIKKNIISEPNQDIIIAPGTTLLLDENVSIISQGRLILNGGERNKVIIKKLDPNKHWGVLAAVGDFSKASKLNYCEISGGSQSSHLNIKFLGMLSFHWSNNIEINQCKIENNIKSDDTLRIVNSNNVIIKNSKFTKCFGDCIDFDYVEGQIINTEISDAKNDGLDFMGSKATIKNLIISNFLDKGISAGERSFLTIHNTNITNGVNGIAAKDESVLSIHNSFITKNSFGINFYRKNWRFSKAGSAEINSSKIINNRIDIKTTDSNLFKVKNSEIKNIVID